MLERKFYLVIATVISLLFAIMLPNFFAPLGIHFFAPPLIMALYFFRRATILWLALAAGLFLDALCISPRFGFFGTTYTVAIALIYPLRLLFFRDWLLTVPIVTLFFSLVTILSEQMFAFLFDIPGPLTTGASLIFSLLLAPLADAIWALIFFALPLGALHYYLRPKTYGKVEV